MTEDTVKARSFGLVQFEFRNGHIEVAATSDIKSVKSRREGGTSIRRHSVNRVLLTSVELEDVMDAIRSADSGGRHAAS
jgi:hypothetical protein